MLCRPRVVDSVTDPAIPAAEDKDVEGLYPMLVEMVTARSYGDGSPRVPATLTIFAEMGVWKLCLNDKDTARTAWVSSPGLVSAIERLEAQLASDSCEWRKATVYAKKK